MEDILMEPGVLIQILFIIIWKNILNELLKKYIDFEINNCQNYQDIKKLYQDNKISRDSE